MRSVLASIEILPTAILPAVRVPMSADNADNDDTLTSAAVIVPAVMFVAVIELTPIASELSPITPTAGT